jgi:hypothetical protein
MTMRVYITKHALTTGILAAQAERFDDTMIKVPSPKRGGRDTFYHNKDWVRTKQEAVARAKAMRDAQIASLGRQLDRLAALTFSA